MKKTLMMLLLVSLFLLGACGEVSAPVTVDSTAVSEASAEPQQTEQPVKESSPALEPITLGAGNGAVSSWLDVYFTDPASPLARQRTGGADLPLVEAINSARLSVDVAIYSLSLNSVRDALINAHRRGVRVRMVMESDNLDRADPQKIKDAGIPILGDRREGLMHNKFVVIDNSEVWLGSMNFTDSGTYDDNNHLIRIRSKEVAQDYAKEFEEMFTEDLFGQDIKAETPHPFVEAESAQMEIYFSPDDGVQEQLLDVIDIAEKSIFFMAFSFTSDEVGDAIRTKAENGVVVYGVMDEEQVASNIGTEYDLFKQDKLNVKIDGNRGQMHHKVMIIDQKIVVLGSYNFTRSAETRNDENLMIIYNEDLASYFVQEFQKIYKQAQ